VSDITEDILSRVQHRQPGPVTWFTRLPPEVQAELDALRQRWITGELGIGKRAISRAIIATLSERGLGVSGVQGVEDWLAGGRHR
jgi:hypothetical protein